MKLATSLVAAVGLVAAVQAEAPFADLAFDQALERAAQEEKIVMVDFFTTWCAPCKKLDHVTWKDERVRAWLSENTVALKIDAEQEVELAGRYRVRAYPTLLFTKPDGTELERIVGFKEPDDFLADAAFIASGKQLIDREREQFAGKENDPKARSGLARACMRHGLHAEALEHLLWCWDHGSEHDPAYAGVRGSFLLGDLARLGQEYPPALAALGERRDACAASLLGGEPDEARARLLALDVMVLDRALGQSEQTLRLQDELAAKPGVSPELVGSFRTTVFEEVAEHLLDARRYDDVMAGLGGDPDAYVDQQIARLRMVEPHLGDEPEEEGIPSALSLMMRRTVNAASFGYAALLGLEQTERASSLAERIIELDPKRPTYETLARRAGDHAGERAPALLDALLARAARDLDDKDLRRLERRVERAKRKARAQRDE